MLVDFWASWCGPCRGENPNVVAAYNKFKNKNFTVLGVSLDEDKENWLEAINNDHLIFDYLSTLPESTPLNILVGDRGYMNQLVNYTIQVNLQR